MNYKIRKNTIERIFDHTVSKKVIIENAYDDYHVQHVHSSTTKSAKRIYEHGNVAILQYDLLRWPMFKFLKNLFFIFYLRLTFLTCNIYKYIIKNI